MRARLHDPARSHGAGVRTARERSVSALEALSAGERREEYVLNARRSRSLSRRLLTCAAVVMLLATASGARPAAAEAGATPFTDIAGTTFAADIEWLFTQGITKGCTATTYCPNRA